MVQEDIISEQEDFKFSLQPNRVDGRPRPYRGLGNFLGNPEKRSLLDGAWGRVTSGAVDSSTGDSSAGDVEGLVTRAQVTRMRLLLKAGPGVRVGLIFGKEIDKIALHN